MKWKCLIVEDEPIARDILQSYVSQVDNLELGGQLGDAIAARAFLLSHPVDLLFLDIKMPRMNGLDLLRDLPNKPKVVIVSAYRDYALDAYELDVVDYLLKPVSFERFLKAVEKATSSGAGSVTVGEQQEAPHLYIKGNRQLQKVFLDQILFLESQRDYVRIKLAGQQDITTRQTISYFADLLPEKRFLRVHRSFIVAIDKVTAIESSRLRILDDLIPIGRQFKVSAADRLKELTPRG
jgi:two-component system LytT family response regulator